MADEEHGYIKEATRHYVAYWITKGSATSDPTKAGLFTRSEFDALHPTTRAGLEFIPSLPTPEKRGETR
jgi:hypothetical protein